MSQATESSKVAYLFTERRSANRWFGLYVDGRAPSLQNLDATTREVRDLRKEGYTIVDTNVPLSNLLRDAHEFREIDDGDRGALKREDEELAHFERYPGLFPEELEKLGTLRAKGIDEGLLWVSDKELYDPKVLAELQREMGTGWVNTIYFLSADNNPKLVGRIQLDQYATLLGYFSGVLDLRNASPAEAKAISGLGRPLNQADLEFLVDKGLDISPAH